MVYTCCAYGCKNVQGKRLCDYPNISFHKFPKDPETKKKWLLFIRKENFNPGPYNLICSSHFKPDDFYPSLTAGYKRLRENAVPSIFNFSSHIQTQTKGKAIQKAFKLRRNSQITKKKSTTQKEAVKGKKRAYRKKNTPEEILINDLNRNTADPMSDELSNNEVSSVTTETVSVKEEPEAMLESEITGNFRNTTEVHVPDFMDYQKFQEPQECAVCYKKGLISEVCTFCPDCELKPPLCLQPCFRTYHCY